MQLRNSLRTCARNAGLAAALFSTVTNPLAPLSAYAESPKQTTTASPIQHVIVIVGENRSFDHVFATYVPKPGETVNNLLSGGIVNANGTPGSNYSRATQYSADITGSTTFQMSPTTGKTPYAALPAPLNGGPTNTCTSNGMCNLGDALSSEDGLPVPPAPYYESLIQGGTGLTGKSRTLGLQVFTALRPTPHWNPGHFNSRLLAHFPITRTQPARFTASMRCGSRRIAVPRMPQPQIPAAAWRTCLPGPK